MTIEGIINYLEIPESFIGRIDVNFQAMLSSQHCLDFNEKDFFKTLDEHKKRFHEIMESEKKQYGHVLSPDEVFDVQLGKIGR